MSDIDYKKKKKNILMLMQKHNITQSSLAESIGMSQPDISKRLKANDDSYRFTLEQTWAIANYFNVSIDELLGRKPQKSKSSTKDICNLLAELLTQYRIVHFKHDVLEEVYEPTWSFSDLERDGNHYQKEVSYTAFYFPDYETPPLYLYDSNPERFEKMQSDAVNYGNYSYDNIRINKFLDGFIDAFEKYDKGEYSEDAYKSFVAACYKLLKK